MPHPLRLACLLALSLALAPFPVLAGPAAPPAPPGNQPPAEKPEDARKRAEEERRAREAQAKEIRKKLDTLRGLIKETNADLQLRTAGSDIFERKRVLENQLRDYIALLSLTDQALAEAERLAHEVEALRRAAGAGPRDAQRLQLVNFLEARRREYMLFATR
ncbi:MAG: hypothetical protein HYZ11_14290 [Candidatus Tectomicrobia bacterium]|uniref:Periplasmic heavy metal sensor n=1 Tax=Tectimicrobiota bacterium TaxID=2528274 RepID=A0A932MNI7_UNCTE|nr:hypothetical protein [Candidatus Tectomicrobia bacterium]